MFVMLWAAAMASPGTLDVAVPDGLPNLNPLFASRLVDYQAQELVFDRLFLRDPRSWEVTSRVVSRAEQVGPDTLDVELVPGVRWHDGTLAGPADVCFSVAVWSDPKLNTAVHRDVRGHLAGCEVRGNTARIRFLDPAADLREQAMFALLPGHRFRYRVAKVRGRRLRKSPVGTGPLRVVARRRAAVDLEAFDNPHHRSHIRRVVLHVDVADPFQSAQALFGAAGPPLHDLYLSPLWPPPGSRPTASGPPPIRQLRSHPRTVVLAWNVRRDVLASAEVRSALDAALNRDLLRADARVSPDVPGPTGAWVPDPRPALSEAERGAALTRAGLTWVDGRWHHQGAPVTLTIGMDEALNAGQRDLLGVVTRALRDVGFEVRPFIISGSDFAAFELGERTMEHYDALIGRWGMPGGDPSTYLRPRPAVGQRGSWFGFAAPELTPPLAEPQLVREVLADQQPYTFLWTDPVGDAAGTHDWPIAPFYLFTDLDRWTWEVTSAP